jgi:hypothetical protein
MGCDHPPSSFRLQCANSFTDIIYSKFPWYKEMYDLMAKSPVHAQEALVNSGMSIDNDLGILMRDNHFADVTAPTDGTVDSEVCSQLLYITTALTLVTEC